jgi:hypothetical protein
MQNFARWLASNAGADLYVAELRPRGKEAHDDAQTTRGELEESG